MNTAVFSGLGKYRDFGLLALRLGLGVAFVLYGYPKMFGGPEMWTQLGGSMEIFKVKMMPVAWGFAAAFAEFGGGILIILGLFFRPAALLMLATMTVATAVHIHKGDPVTTVLTPLVLGFVFFSLLFDGPGKYSVDGK